MIIGPLRPSKNSMKLNSLEILCFVKITFLVIYPNINIMIVDFNTLIYNYH